MKPNKWKEINCEVCTEVRVTITLAIRLKCTHTHKANSKKEKQQYKILDPCPGPFLTKYGKRYLSPWCILYPLSRLFLWFRLPQYDCFFSPGKNLSSSMLTPSVEFHSIIQGSRKADIIQTRDSELLSILDLSQFLMAYQLWQSEEFLELVYFES